MKEQKKTVVARIEMKIIKGRRLYRLITNTKIKHEHIEEALEYAIDQVKDKGENPWTCEKCGKPIGFSSRQDAEKAHDDPEYARKMGVCMCKD